MKRDTPILVRSLPDSGILYIRSSHSDNFTMDFDTWTFKKICWIEAGEGVLEFEDQIISFTQGDILTIRKHPTSLCRRNDMYSFDYLLRSRSPTCINRNLTLPFSD